MLQHNIRAKEALLSALIDIEMANVLEVQTSHGIWKKLETLYEGDAYVKCAKMQSLKGRYECLRMSEDENITSYMQKVNELVCNIRCAGGKLEESKIVGKVLRSLPVSYKNRVATIEEIRTVIDVTRDQLVGKLSTFEMSEFGDSLPKSESAFKASVFRKQRFDPGESSSRRLTRYEKVRKVLEEDESELEELEGLLVKRLLGGSGKYEGKLPFKCFACKKIGHFASRCPERVSKPNPNKPRD